MNPETVPTNAATQTQQITPSPAERAGPEPVEYSILFVIPSAPITGPFFVYHLIRLPPSQHAAKRRLRRAAFWQLAARSSNYIALTAHPINGSIQRL